MKIFIICAVAVAITTAFNLRAAKLEQRNNIVGEGRVTNGNNATEGQFPYQVGLFCIQNETSNIWCGGSCISNQWLLTAAHCTYHARACILYLGSTTPFTSPKLILLATEDDIIIHADYNPITLRNDISLVKMAEPIEFSETIQPIGLPLISSSYPTYTGEKVVASGWGHTADGSGIASTLQYGDLEIISNSRCAMNYTIIQPSNICASTSDRVSTCQGDSGGPVVLKSNNTQIGVVSFGSNKSCTATFPVVFTRVTSYLGWIKDRTGI